MDAVGCRMWMLEGSWMASKRRQIRDVLEQELNRARLSKNTDKVECGCN